MTIIKYYKHQGNIDELSERYKAFARLKNIQLNQSSHLQWHNKTDGTISYEALAVFFGKSGYGKSSTVNAFFGDSIMKTSDVVACTRECQSLDFELSTNCYFSLGDLPGIGESEYRDKEYLKMYKDFLVMSTVVVYVIRADTRDYSIDEAAYKHLFANETERQKVIIALNCCDKIEPVTREFRTIPSPEQMQNIDKKINAATEIFNPINNIIPYSAATCWNMNLLAKEIVDVVCTSGNVRDKTHVNPMGILSALRGGF